MRTKVEQLDLCDRVMLADKLPYRDLPRLYRNAKLLVFALKCQNSPNILLESLASAQPIVCSNRATMLEFACDAVLCFDPSSPEDLAAKLRLLLDDERELQRPGARPAQASRRYDWRVTGDRTWRALQAEVEN